MTLIRKAARRFTDLENTVVKSEIIKNYNHRAILNSCASQAVQWTLFEIRIRRTKDFITNFPNKWLCIRPIRLCYFHTLRSTTPVYGTIRKIRWIGLQPRHRRMYVEKWNTISTTIEIFINICKKTVTIVEFGRLNIHECHRDLNRPTTWRLHWLERVRNVD